MQNAAWARRSPLSGPGGPPPRVPEDRVTDPPTGAAIPARSAGFCWPGLISPFSLVVVIRCFAEALGAVWTLSFAEFLQRPDEWQALGASLWICSPPSSCRRDRIPLAFLFERAEFPGRRTLGTLIALPVVLPPLVGVIAFLFLYGESGFVARVVQSVTHGSEPPWRLSGPGAILFVHAYSMFVYFYLFTRAGLARLDNAFLEAAQSLGAGRGRILRRVTSASRTCPVGSRAVGVHDVALLFSAPISSGTFRV